MNAFRNEPLLELRRAPERDRLVAALAEIDADLPVAVPVIVGGERRLDPTLSSIDPGDPQRLVAAATVATPAEVDAAVAAAAVAARVWSAVPATERATILSRAAAELRTRRYELAALAVRECAKPWAEADADVREAAVADGATVDRVREVPDEGGFFSAPALVTGVASDAPVARDEIFGPVVTVEPGTTGAMVGRQPFGGNRLSGTGTKAGGPDYLLHFVEPVVVTENTVRHGLAP